MAPPQDEIQKAQEKQNRRQGEDGNEKGRFQYTAPQQFIEEMSKSGPTSEPLIEKGRKIADREDAYHQRKRLRVLSPERYDPFEQGAKTPDVNVRTYAEIMYGQQIENERTEVQRKIEKQKEEQNRKLTERRDNHKNINLEETKEDKARSRSKQSTVMPSSKSEWDKPDKSTAGLGPSKWDTPKRMDETPGRRSRWDLGPMGTEQDATPRVNQVAETPTPGRWADATPGRFGETPNRMIGDTPQRIGETPTPRRMGRSRWDDKTPMVGGMTPTTFAGYTPTPGGGMATPTGQYAAYLPPDKLQALRWEREIDERNRPLTDEELDQILPREGYEIVKPPENYQPAKTAARKLLTAQTPVSQSPMYYQMPDATGKPYEIPGTPTTGPGALPAIKPEDLSYFAPLLQQVNEEELSLEDQKERKIMMLLLKIKNGTPPMRKSALRQITEKARELGAGPLFNQILPLLMSPTLEDQERHLLVKVIDRIMYKLDDMVRPFVHKILVVIEPLLIDEDYYARVEGREIISNLAKAAGLATMISVMRPDIDHQDEYVRNTTARAFAVVASALGIPSLLPFLKAVCQSKKSWQARHTGIKIVQQIAILMGCAVLPHLKNLVEIIEHGLKDEQQKVRTITALALAALAESSYPYGIEAFDSVLVPLWEGIRMHRGKGLAAFLKAIGYIIPLMNAEHASEYTKEVMPILIREFQSSDEEMKKIVLKVVKQCVATEGVEASYVRDKIMPEFFRNFWVRKMALDRRNYKQLVETTVEIAQKVGGAEIVGIIVEDLKDDNEPYRKMVMETIEKIVILLGVADVGSRLEVQLMDGILHAFQEQSSDDTQVMLNGFGAVVNTLGQRAKVYFSQIVGIIQWRLNNKSARVRQQAADLIQRVALCMKNCGEETRLGRLGVMLYEMLGEEYPEVLGSILGALKAIVNVVGMQKMTPPIKDLLPRLTPILKNRHEKVQENVIDLIGRIADRGPSFVSAKEWMRICFDLLDLLKAHKKGIRRATVNTFGYIAKAIGPQDVLATLLNNLKVQERQNRVCTTVAIAIVAETCGPFTVLPALMNEYRVPELNVQNGVLKSLSFMFEYIGEMGKDYIYAVAPLLEDALTDRDLVHRQTAASAVKHLAIGVCGLSCEDALVHLLNYVWPNIFETSPHVINAVTEAIEAMRISLGPGAVLLYVLQGLYHPARRVREVYWKIYNMLYIGSQDALVAYYPNLDNDRNNSYTRNEMLYFV